MAWIKKRKGVWYAHWYDSATNNTARKSLKTRDEREARRLLTELRKELRLIEQGLPVDRLRPSPLTIHEALDQYSEYRRSTGHSLRGVAYVRSHAAVLKRYLPNIEADRLQLSNLLEYCRQRKAERLRYKTKDVRNQTLNKEVGSLLAALRWALKEEEIKRPEERRITRVPVKWKPLPPEKHARHLPDDFGLMQADLARIEDHLRAAGNWPMLNAIMLARHLCLRVAGIHSVADWRGIDLRAGRIRFLQSKKKTTTWRTLDLPSIGPLRSYLEDARTRDPKHFPVQTHDGLFYKAQEKILGRSDDRTRYNFTSLRHLFVYEAKSKGLSAWQVSSILGHTDSNLVKRVYGQFSDIEAARALQALQE